MWKPSLSLLACLSIVLLKPLSASQCYQNFNKRQYSSCAQLSPNVTLHWAVSDGSITWAVDVDGVWDWVAVGISESGMLGADIAVAAHDLDAHQWTASDYWSTGFVTPQLDQQQDVALKFIARESTTNVFGSTLVALSRPLVSCDPAGQDRPVLNDTRQTVIFAYGKGPFGYHNENRGEYDVVFIPNVTAGSSSGSSSSSSLPPLQTLDITMASGFVVPQKTTAYWCVNLALPNATKYHLYRYEPLIDNQARVHHFLAYSCRGSSPPATPLGQPYDCLDTMECEDYYIGWAPGVDGVDAPTQAALPFGAGTGILYLALQIHYNNPGGLAGQTDSSGFRLSYSSSLKQYDMGVLTLGSDEIAVPAGTATWSTAPNVCPGACTSRLVAGTLGTRNPAPANGGAVILVDSFYHMHLLGKSIVTRHVRGGQELPPLGSRDYFDFNYQAPISIPPGTRQLLPGDSLITTCTFQGNGRPNVTRFGLGSEQEMCFNFLTYYPANPAVGVCMALPRGANLSICATWEDMDTVSFPDGVPAAVQAGVLMPIPTNLTYKPYQPTCKRSAPALPSRPISDSADGGSQGQSRDDDDDDDDDEDSEAQRHRRNVGGAVAAILVVTLVGAVAIVVVYRTMKKKQQAEEEKHLFEKYNPNTLVLPMTAVPLPPASAAAAAGGPSSTAAAAAPAGGEHFSVGSVAGGGGGMLGKGYAAVPNEVRTS